MYNVILGIVIVLSIVMVIAIMMQPSKQKTVQQVHLLAERINYSVNKKHVVLKQSCNVRQR